MDNFCAVVKRSGLVLRLQQVQHSDAQQEYVDWLQLRDFCTKLPFYSLPIASNAIKLE